MFKSKHIFKVLCLIPVYVVLVMWFSIVNCIIYCCCRMQLLLLIMVSETCFRTFCFWLVCPCIYQSVVKFFFCMIQNNERPIPQLYIISISRSFYFDRSSGSCGYDTGPSPFIRSYWSRFWFWLIWVLRLIQECFTFVEPIVHLSDR